MIKVGHHLSDLEIERRYTEIAHLLGLPDYFYPAVAQFSQELTGHSILDVGCGNGDLLIKLVEKFPDACLIGTEISSGRLHIAQHRLNGKASLIQTGGKGYNLPVGNNSIDLVFVTEVIEHLKQPQLFLREIHRALAPEGRLILTTPNSDAYPFWELFAYIAERSPQLPLVRRFLPFEHPLKTLQPIDTVISFEEVFSLLQESGFVPVRVFGREALSALFSLPIIRYLDYRGLLPRQFIDYSFNRIGKQKLCYRIFWECRKTMYE